MPTGDSYQQNMAHVHIFNFHHSTITYRLFIQCEQMAVSGFWKHDINKQKCLNKGPGGCEGLCVEGKGSSGIFNMTSSLLNSIHFLTLVLEITFKVSGVHVPFTPGDWVQLGQSGRVATPHLPLLPDFTPWLSPPGVLTQAGPPLVFVTHCSQLYCDRPHFTWLHLDIWSSSGCHLFLKEGGRSQNWDPWYAHLSAALVAAHHVMWQTKLFTQYYLKFPIKDV